MSDDALHAHPRPRRPLTLGEMRDHLDALPPGTPVPGLQAWFNSYRGNAADVAFEPGVGTTAEALVDVIEANLGGEMEGHDGGLFPITEACQVFVAGPVEFGSALVGFDGPRAVLAADPTRPDVIARLEAATQGEWSVEVTSEGVQVRATPSHTIVATLGDADIDGVLTDAELIARAPADLRALLEENALLRAENRTLAKAIGDLSELWDHETSRGRAFLADPRNVPALRAILAASDPQGR